jgi:hypothetical protein
VRIRLKKLENRETALGAVKYAREPEIGAAATGRE